MPLLIELKNVLTFESQKKEKSVRKQERSLKNIDWQSLEIQIAYNESLQGKLNQTNILISLNKIDLTNAKTILTEIINELGSSMRETIDEISLKNQNKIKTRNKHIKTKS